ncbi:ABC transporter substrate-binding protein [Porticoccaceae bacterium LTM1]|nr:ABC transporter substrate-binding protein [Porticoccaceae bacterium LTM1]
MKHILIAFLMMLGCLANAAEGKTVEPDQLVQEMTNDLLNSMEQYRETVDANPEPFFDYLESRLNNIIDFPWIAKNVMGPYRDGATDDQQERFAKVFRRGLVETYGRGLLSYSDEKIEVMPLEGGANGKRKVSIDQKIYGKTDVYPVSYSMGLNRDGEWKITNVILNGVNLGKTFRNQFIQAAKQHDGDIDKVIENWAAKV